MNFNQLYYFYVVAKEGSIKMASQKLHLTQPTISAQIKQLEEDLGQELFERKHRKLGLNPVGKVVVKQAEKIFRMANDLQEALMSEGAPAIRDQFRVGAIQSLSNSFISEFSMDLWKDKSIHMVVHQGSLEELIRMLNESELEMILTDQPFSNSKRYKSMRIAQDKLVVVANPKMKHLRKCFPRSLHGVEYLAFAPKTRIQQDVDHYFETSGIRPDLIGRVDDVTLARVVTQNANCFSVMPARAVRESIKNSELVTLGSLKSIHLDIWGAYSVTSPAAPFIRRLIKSYFSYDSN